MKYQLALNKTFCTTPPLLIHRRLKHYQRHKLTKQCFLSRPHRFSTQSSQYQNWKVNKYSIREPFIINYSFIIKMTTKSEMGDAVIIWLLSKFLFHLFSFACWRIKFLFSIFFFQLQFLFFLPVMTNNQTKCGIYEKIAMWAGMMNEWLIMSSLMVIVLGPPVSEFSTGSQIFMPPADSEQKFWKMEIENWLPIGFDLGSSWLEIASHNHYNTLKH